MGQFVDATYLTEESTSNVKVALKMRKKLTTDKEKEIKKWRRDKKEMLIRSINPGWHDLYSEIAQEPTNWQSIRDFSHALEMTRS